MGWPYQFIALDSDQKQARRQSLDLYAAYAQLSALIPIVVVLLFRFGSWLTKKFSSQRGAYSAVPDSPALKQRRRTLVGHFASIKRRVVWWLGDEVVFLGMNWGQRAQIVVGIVWAVWLVFLSVIGTGNDYLHLTKRFGIVALSQLPLQYLLALRVINPVALAFGSSHEQVNRWHRVLGWVVYLLLFAHACLYLNFYIQEGILAERLVRLIPALGVAGFIGMSLMNTTALKTIRQYSYRVFFLTHLTVALLLPPAIFFHSHHGGRQYVVEALLFFLIDIAKRKIDTVTAPAVLELIPGTSLIKIVFSIPSQKISRFRKYPGMHVYLSIPPGSRRSAGISAATYLLFEATFNPFTIASVDEESGDLTLVAKRQKGPMTKALVRCAADSLAATKIPLSLIATENPAAKVQMVWAVRGAGDATWSTAEGILDDDNIQLYLTGNILENTSDVTTGLTDDNEAVELEDSMYANRGEIRKRPNLRKIVDDIFRQGVEDRVAVLVCGPEEMARELRSYVGTWVHKGRDVWWHNENFAW
ncbi:metalloreductase Fre8 [Hypoxylon trugodes]|uniref:metalloreductase Fre8 n=1 Tax=Hypoxylon trugodes TaxID=326681 RepID=UPI00218E4893|nr:metalloreductase Fre8 [Hypoxylon trugodes]KAI1385393.1 metalloreductase Fre8 [Hypoxylon trugodes]